MSPVSVASSMASAPPLRSCLRAAAQATNLRALRTAVAGCSVISIIFQVGSDVKILEVPTLPAGVWQGDNAVLTAISRFFNQDFVVFAV